MTVINTNKAREIFLHPFLSIFWHLTTILPPVQFIVFTYPLKKIVSLCTMTMNIGATIHSKIHESHQRRSKSASVSPYRAMNDFLYSALVILQLIKLIT